MNYSEYTNILSPNTALPYRTNTDGDNISNTNAKNIQNVTYTPIFNIGGKETSVSSMTELIAKRFLKLKGKPLGILCNPRQETEKISDFIYSSRMIESTGFSALNNINKEIDDLINFCYESF